MTALDTYLHELAHGSLRDSELLKLKVAAFQEIRTSCVRLGDDELVAAVDETLSALER